MDQNILISFYLLVTDVTLTEPNYKTDEYFICAKNFYHTYSTLTNLYLNLLAFAHD